MPSGTCFVADGAFATTCSEYGVCTCEQCSMMFFWKLRSGPDWVTWVVAGRPYLFHKGSTERSCSSWMGRPELSCNETVVNPSKRKQLLSAEHHGGCLRKLAFIDLFAVAYPSNLLVESGGLWREAARSPHKIAMNWEFEMNLELHPIGYKRWDLHVCASNLLFPSIATETKKCYHSFNYIWAT